MANTRFLFLSSERDDRDAQLECFRNDFDEIFISIEDPNQDILYSNFICLDKETAIKLVKVLKTEINKISGNG